MNFDLEDLYISGLIAVLVAVFAALIYASVKQGEEWAAFKTAHACVVIGKMTGDTFTTFSVGANGQPAIGVGSTPSKTGYQCDDGVTYWR